MVLPRSSINASRNGTNGSRLKMIGIAIAILTCMYGVSIYVVFQKPLTSSNTIIGSPMTITSEKASRHPDQIKILHVVTSLTEYDVGTRGTERGDDRLINRLLPTLKMGVESMEKMPHWQVDVFLILGFRLLPERKRLIKEALPEGVGLEVWDDAIPFHYRKNEDMIALATHALARQHRFVVKDKLDQYDFFSCWEDDMQITANHINHFLHMSKEIETMQQNAEKNPKKYDLNPSQLKRLFPGFIRVEVLGNGYESQAQIDPVEVNTKFKVDPDICCAPVSTGTENEEKVKSEQIIMWEIGIKGLGVRKLPGGLGWSVIMNSKVRRTEKRSHIESFWPGTGTSFESEERPGGGDPRYFAQQGGFMATKQQVLNFQEVCPGGFLPPFSDIGAWTDQSGLKPQNVEFWSGGYQIFGRCFLQRVLSVDNFSKHLIHHRSDNKQKTISRRRLVKADVLLGQLATTMEKAVAASHLSKK